MRTSDFEEDQAAGEHKLRGRPSLDQYRKLLALIDHGSETKLHGFLEKNPCIWYPFLALNRVGHHGYRVLSKQSIAPSIPDIRRGMIPDFIIGGDSSDGWRYFIVELKSPNQKLFATSGKEFRFSATANRGIVQLLGYLDFCSEYQAILRDYFSLADFREPSGILLMDRQETFTSDRSQRSLKRAWNRAAPNLEIRSWDSLSRAVARGLVLMGVLRDEVIKAEEEKEIEYTSDVRNELQYMREQFSRGTYLNEDDVLENSASESGP